LNAVEQDRLPPILAHILEFRVRQGDEIEPERGDRRLTPGRAKLANRGVLSQAVLPDTERVHLLIPHLRVRVRLELVADPPHLRNVQPHVHEEPALVDLELADVLWLDRLLEHTPDLTRALV